MNNIKNQIMAVVGNVKAHWNVPPEGRDMPFKEIAALSIGGFGSKFIIHLMTSMILGVGNTLIGLTIGIPPVSMGIIYAISVILSFPLGALRANMVDRSRLKKGKYRPFVLYMGLPTVILGSLFVWMPYDNMSLILKCITVLGFNVGFQFFYMFFLDVYESIPNVLSSNTIERSDAHAIRSVVANFSPTLITVLMPLFAKLILGKENDLVSMETYRITYPILLTIGFVLSMLVYTNTTEKVVEAKTHTIKVKLSDSMRAVMKNKYFWIMAIATSACLLETAYGNLLFWMYTYQNATSMTAYSIITLIYGNASLWPMLLAPLVIRWIGKRKLLLATNTMNIVFILTLLPIMLYGDMEHVIWVVLVCMFVNMVATGFGGTIQPSMQGDVRDYQHYISGERMDGIFVYLTLIANFAAMIFAFVMLVLQEAAGLNLETLESLGITSGNVYDVLYNEEYFRSITSLLIIISAVGAVMNVVPYFFYDLTEDKQRSIVSVLKIRAFFEDYGNNVATDEKLVEAVEIINSAIENKDKEKVPPTKDAKKTAKVIYKDAKRACSKAKRAKDANLATLQENMASAKANLKAERKLYREKIAFNKSIDTAIFVYKEINKYNTEHGQASYNRALETISLGIENYTKTNFISVEDARALPNGTQDEKDARKVVITQAKNFIASKKLVEKHFNGSVSRFDDSRFDAVLNPLNQCEKDILEAYKAEIKAKEDKNRSALPAINEQIASLKATRKELRKQLTAVTNDKSLYVRAVRPFIEAENLIKQKKNYDNLGEVQGVYLAITATKD